MTTALKAVAWILVGIAVTLFLVVDPLDLHPVDTWIWGASHGSGDIQAQPSNAASLYTCPMHPEIIQDHPGRCPICGMDLVPVENEPADHDGSADRSAPLWTCPMHPQILEEKPGSCPICGMDLVEAEAEPAENPASHHGTDGTDGPVVRIDPAIIQKMNVTTQPVGRRDIVRQIRTVGHLDYDLEGMVTVTTKYPGFVESVYVDSVGQLVRRGDRLFDVYAPELVQTQRELLSAIRYAESLSEGPEDVQRRARGLVTAARTRLEYWDLTEDQIRSIESAGAVQRTVTVFAPSSGIVMQRTHGLEGMAIRPGMDVIHIADLSKLLLTAEVFEDQLRWVTVGTPASIDITYLPGETIVGRVRYIEPEVREQTRTVNLVIEVPNPGGRLRVGMYATVHFEPIAIADAVAVPIQAVLRTGERDVVVTALGDGRFAAREVQLGVEGDDGFVHVLAGISADDVIVTSAQFLIDSESNLRAAISKMVSAPGHAGH